MELTTAAQEMYQLRKDLEAHLAASKKREDELRAKIKQKANILASAVEGIDPDKINLAKTVVYIRGTYEGGGADRNSVIYDAIKQLATGHPLNGVYGDLWTQYFGTKNYSQWNGQRSDHPYGLGPAHGSTCFAVGLVEDVRKSRKQADLTAHEIEAAIYYLTNIQRVQEAERKAAQQAAA
jgi:hypothetical protein